MNLDPEVVYTTCVMSWLSGIAGKAEALLDRMDLAAATSIQSTGLASTPQRAAHHTSLAYEPTASVAIEKSLSVPSIPSSSSLAPHTHKTAAYSPVTHPEAPPQTTPTPSSYNAYSKSRSQAPNEDSIFQFLNTPTRPVTKKPQMAKPQPSPPPPSQPQMEESGPVLSVETQAVGEGGEVRVREEGRETGEGEEKEETDNGGQEVEYEISSTATHTDEPRVRGQGVDSVNGQEVKGQGMDSVRGQEVKSQEVDSVRVHEVDTVQHGRGGQTLRSSDREVETVADSATVVQSQPTPFGGDNKGNLDQKMVSLQRKVSDLELENKLLKREVSSLNDELGTVLERVREAEEGVALHRSEAESLREQTAASERVIRQLRSHDEDTQATLEARDSQIQVLRKELQESENREAILTKRLKGQDREKDRLLQDASMSSEASNHALNVLKSQVQQLEEQLARERELTVRAKTEFAERESFLQSQQQQLSDTVAAQHRQLALLQSKVGESQRAVQSANRERTQANREHDEYKKRAGSILQAKEKMITSLQEGGGGVSGPAQEANLVQLQLEKETMKAELETARLKEAGLREELREVEDQHTQEMEQLIEQVHELESVVVSERALQRSATDDLQRLQAELEAGRETWDRERGSLTSLLQEKTAEITALEAKVHPTPLSPHSHAELESRLHELTESLIQKQTTLEGLSSERHSLKLQLERTQGQLLDSRRAVPLPPHTAVNGLEVSSQTDTHIRPMVSVLPSADSASSDGRLHNVRRAMNTFDTFSVRLAVFLRRYPYARLFLLLYMALLHVWVLVVLLTYTPEVHDMPADPSDFRP